MLSRISYNQSPSSSFQGIPLLKHPASHPKTLVQELSKSLAPHSSPGKHVCVHARLLPYAPRPGAWTWRLQWRIQKSLSPAVYASDCTGTSRRIMTSAHKLYLPHEFYCSTYWCVGDFRVSFCGRCTSYTGAYKMTVWTDFAALEQALRRLLLLLLLLLAEDSPERKGCRSHGLSGFSFQIGKTNI